MQVHSRGSFAKAPTPCRQGSFFLVLAAMLVLAGCTVFQGRTTEDYAGAHPPREGSVVLGERPVIALVLGGGGPRGFAHVGVIKVLENAGIRPGLIVGASAGSVIGAAYASGMSADRLERVALALTADDIADAESWLRPYFRGQALADKVDAIVHDRRIEELPIPLAVVATDAVTGKAVVLTRGATGAAVRASSAIPGYYRRVRIGARELMDGDVAAPLPVEIARALGADVVIGVNVMAYLEDMPVAVRDHPELSLADYLRHTIVEHEIADADAIVHPRLPFYVDYTEAHRRAAIRIGAAAAHARIEDIRGAIAKVHRSTPPVSAQGR